MRTFMRVLFALAVPGVVFGFLTRVPRLEFDFVDDAMSVREPWLDVATALALTAAIVLAATIIFGALLVLGFDVDPRRRRAG